MARCEIQIIERNRGYLAYKEMGGDAVRLIIKYGEENYTMSIIEMKENTLRAFRKWNHPEEVEDLVVAVKLRPRTAKKLRDYMYRINTAIEISLLWFELERATIFITPKGADIKFWKLDLDEPDKPRQKRPPITHVLSRLKLRLLAPS
ncbi:MAG: hypothetical protein ACO2PN_20935 [Pyrobaculum sp.]